MARVVYYFDTKKRLKTKSFVDFGSPIDIAEANFIIASLNEGTGWDADTAIAGLTDLEKLFWVDALADVVNFEAARRVLNDLINQGVYGKNTRNTIAAVVSSVTVEDADPDALVVVFNKVVTIADLTGLSLDGSWTGTTITGVSGSGTNTLTFALDTPVANGESGNFIYGATNTIVDVHEYEVDAGSDAVTNNVL